jgi:hypothetical protein
VVEMVNVDAPCPAAIRARLEGLAVTIILDRGGAPDRVTVPLKEFKLVNVITEVPAAPCRTDTDEGLADNPKSGPTCLAVSCSPQPSGDCSAP